MKLHTRIWALVLAIMTALLVVVVCVGGWVFSTGRNSLELAEALEKTDRILVLLDQETVALKRETNDYAFWIDSIRYVHGEKPEFATENFEATSIANLDVGYILVHRTDASFVGGVVRPFAGGEPRPAVAADDAAFRPEIARVLAAPAGVATRSGLLVSEGHLVLAATAPIRTEEVPATQGTMVFGRWIDDLMVERFRRVAGHAFSIELGRFTPAPGERWERAPGKAIGLLHLPGDRLRVRLPLCASDGTELGSALLEMGLPVRAQARETAWFIIGVLVVSCLLCGLLFGVVLRRMVVRRLERLTSVLLAAGSDASLGIRAPIDGSDEIAGLSRQFNQLMESLARGRQERQQAHEDRERLQMQLFQAQKMEAIGEFAGGIAHDFNNSLTSVVGWVALAREVLPPEHEASEPLGHAVAAAEHAGAVVGQLLAYSKQGAPELAAVSLGELLGGSRTLLRAGLPRGVDLQLNLSAEADTVMADRTQVLQVVMNLVKNASDAMGGKGRITASIGRSVLPDPGCPGSGGLPPGAYVHLVVRDEGPGISPANLRRLFEPFFTTKGSGKGTGLGLAVVRSVALRHGGAVGVSSPAGEGAAFHVYFPAVAAAPTSAVVSPAGALRLLVIEDDATVLRVIVALLQKRGHTVETASNGEEGWTRFEAMQPPPDVVLTDMTMPELGGLQFGERLFNSGHPVPVVLMTAYAATLDAAQLKRAGFAGLVAKPIVLEELLATLAKAKAGSSQPMKPA